MSLSVYKPLYVLCVCVSLFVYQSTTSKKLHYVSDLSKFALQGLFQVISDTG